MNISTGDKHNTGRETPVTTEQPESLHHSNTQNNPVTSKWRTGVFVLRFDEETGDRCGDYPGVRHKHAHTRDGEGGRQQGQTERQQEVITYLFFFSFRT